MSAVPSTTASLAPQMLAIIQAIVISVPRDDLRAMLGDRLLHAIYGVVEQTTGSVA